MNPKIAAATEPYTDRHRAEFDPADYTTLLMHSNPCGAKKDTTPALLASLEQPGFRLGLQVKGVNTAPTVEGNMASLAATVTPETIIGVKAGDGGLSAMLEAARRLQLHNPIYAVEGGRMNDILSKLFPWRQRRHPERILERRDVQIRKIRPILATIALDNGELIQTSAYGYVSRGVTGEVAATVNQRRSQHREGFKRYIDERIMAVRVLRQAVPFTASINGGPAQSFVDIVAAKNGRMAGNLRPAVDIFKPEFRLIRIRNKLAAIGVIAAATAGIPIGRKVRDGEVVEFDMAAAPHVFAQVDGEHKQGTLQRLAIAEDGVNVLTTHRAGRRKRLKLLRRRLVPAPSHLSHESAQRDTLAAQTRLLANKGTD